MTKQRLKFGQAGEEAAQAFLKKRRYRILQTNFRTPAGEIDIVAEHRGVLVFVEVKTRSGDRFGSPAEAVTPAKQRQLGRMAQQFLAQHPHADRPCRFDVVAVTGDPAHPPSWNLELFEDAFRL